MDTITLAKARENLAKTVERVCVEHDPILITRENAEPVVVISLSDYEAITDETAYLSKSPENARRLLEAIDDIRQGKAKERELID